MTKPDQALQATASPTAIHLPSLLQGVLTALALLFMWGGALITGFMGIVSAIFSDPGMGDPLSMFLLSALLLGCGALLLPSVYYGISRAFGRPALDSLPWLRRTRPILWIFAFPVILAIGYGVVKLPVLSWIALPPLHLLAVGLPVGWMLFLAVRNLPVGSSQRLWGVFDSGLVLAPALISVLELLAIVAFMLPVAMYIASQPELLGKIMALAETIQETPPTPETLLNEFGSYLVRPAVLFGVLIFGAVVVPLIEELIKPMGVWLLAKRRLRPAAGFAAGAISGAGYAFFESLALTSGGQEWPALMVARVGTAAVHILTTAITGWALVQAWTRRRYVLLGVCYLTAVAIHGLWNGLTIYSAFSSLAQMQNLPSGQPPSSSLAMAAPTGLALLGIAALGVLILINRRLAAGTVTSAAPPDAFAPAEASSSTGASATTEAPPKSVL
jgi:hypothetical protein